MPTTTTNFSFNKPLVNNATDKDLWGGQLNDNWDSNDSLLLTARDYIKRDVNFAASPYSLVAADRNRVILVDASSGNVTINLLGASAVGDGFTLIVKKTDSSTNTVTIDGSTSETIDGATTRVLTGQNQAEIYECDGTEWHVIATGNVTASETVAGVLETATDAEYQAGTATDKALVPSNFDEDATIAATGSITLPTGLIMKWGKSNTTSNNPQTVTFDTAFPNTIFNVQLTTTNDVDDGDGEIPIVVGNPSVSSMSVKTVDNNANSKNPATFFWYAIGN